MNLFDEDYGKLSSKLSLLSTADEIEVKFIILFCHLGYLKV